ncbi:MAG: glutamine--fructose-6-phosphate transaminase (isomerizing) [Pseudomonadales bacterium]|nr:glutamine--fructose-6-phosphate transaminase (isomerizing) [Pseudomonadales bacterium]MDP6471406.1 glutamine--fructose-6-phosphate transaminase (isomerizing) [Pseudomonadales bacterium]MDP6828575.1 glutamine--fructose-6-phosphate transaminase (isomerizing) [Pseudomonadales bacterium]MDP6971999.1 glutamine--fructose-6-phosphate transaminase (isomerizing) [Pseudomonadales bacterium]
MCGIVGAAADRNVPPILIEGLQRLEYRGYDSAGIAVLPNDRSGTVSAIELRRKAGKVNELVMDLADRPVHGTTGIAHTRWATHGPPCEENAHPHVSGGRVALVHNGIIENYEDLREELTEQGYGFASDTDSEVIVHLIDRGYVDGRTLLDAVREAVKRLEGAYAIGVIAHDQPGRIVAARAGSPLVVGKGIGENFIASDVLALKAVTDRFIFLEEGDLVEITADDISIWNLADESVIRSTVKVEMAAEEVGKGNYRHHMQKEIFEQAAVLKNALDGRVGRHRVLEQAFGLTAAEVFDATEGVTIVACGTSFYAASVARYWIEDLVGIPCQVEIASEFRYRKVAVAPGHLFVTITQSGETADTLAALRVAKVSGYFATLTICNVATSSTVRESDLAVMLQAGPEVGVASTKAFTSQLLNLFLLTLLLGRRHGLTEQREAELVTAMHTLDSVLERILRLDEQICALAERFVDRHHALFLGRGLMYPVAMEGALKLKEISYIHAEGYPAGELKHGPLALVDDDMPVVAVAPNDELLEKLQSNLQEVRARGGELIVFADADSGFRESEGVTVIALPRVAPVLAPIVYAVPLQLLAYHVAVLKGTDVDQPRNLAKSVTVE